jgi:hypothetical protein
MTNKEQRPATENPEQLVRVTNTAGKTVILNRREEKNYKNALATKKTQPTPNKPGTKPPPTS